MLKNDDYSLFDRSTQALIYGYQVNAIQRMLDFDYICKRETPSVAAIISHQLSLIPKAIPGFRASLKESTPLIISCF